MVALVMVGSPQKTRASCRGAAYVSYARAARDYAGEINFVISVYLEK
jgi:hypothetical protein